MSAPWSGNCIWMFHSFCTRSSLLLNIELARGRRQWGSVQHDWWHYAWCTHSRLVIKWMAVMSYMHTKTSFDDELAWCAVVTMIGLVATFLVPWSLFGRDCIRHRLSLNMTLLTNTDDKRTSLRCWLLYWSKFQSQEYSKLKRHACSLNIFHVFFPKATELSDTITPC